MNLPQTSIAVLLYPGLLTAVIAGALFGLTVSGRRSLPPLGALGTREGRAALAGAVFAGLGLAALPWPLHPAGAGASWLWAWAAFELAFLLPLLPALTAGAPAVVRAAIREAQIGALARATLWAALAAALAAHADWRAATLPAHLLALAVAAAALPAAIGSGPFAPEERVSPEGAEAGLPEPVRAAEGWARDVRSGALVAAVAVAALPVALAPPPLALAMVAAGLVVGLLALARLRGRTPRLTLPAALRLFTLVGLPAAALASAALALAQRL
jgi:hypothetical protein